MVAGLEEITSGQLLIDGEVMNDVAPKDRNIAMVFQSYALYPHMTVYDNMAFGLKLRKFSRTEIDRRVQDAAEKLGLKPYLDRKPAALSGGQRQRVALGRAIVRDAKVFLMDEPLSNLDAKLRVQMRSELIKIHESLGTTTIYVTHDQIEAMTMASRIVVMRDGWIQQIGAPKEIYDNPDNIFVGGFIGTPPMNFVNGVVGKDGIFECGSHKYGVVRLQVPQEKFELLKEKGMSQKEFAQRTGIAESSISDWKKKRTNPVSDKILIICEVLGVTPYELLSGAEHTGTRSKTNEMYVFTKDTELGMLIETYQQLSVEQQKRLLGYMDALKD